MAKGRQVESNEDRTIEYRDWRHEFGGGCYVTDIDQIEWRMVDGMIVPKAVIELTRIDHTGSVENVLAAILNRIKDKSHGNLLRLTAARMECEAFIVVIQPGLEFFYMYCLTIEEKAGWFKVSKDRYEQWVRSL